MFSNSIDYIIFRQGEMSFEKSFKSYSKTIILRINMI